MSNMDAGAVNAIAELALKTQRTAALDVSGFPHEVMIVGPDGKVDWREKPATDIGHRVDSVYDLVRLIEAEDHAGSLWVAPEQLTYVIDPVLRYNRVCCPLDKTEHVEALAALSDMKWHTQKQMIFMLQTLFDGCVPDDLVQALRYIKFSNTSEGHGMVTHGGDSLGRQVAAECKGTNGEIPEYVNCSISLFSTPGWEIQQKRVIKCRLLIDTEDQRFCMMPLPGELDAAERAVLAALVHVLTGDEEPGDQEIIKCPVYLGEPS